MVARLSNSRSFHSPKWVVCGWDFVPIQVIADLIFQPAKRMVIGFAQLGFGNILYCRRPIAGYIGAQSNSAFGLGYKNTFLAHHSIQSKRRYLHSHRRSKWIP
jgi:hypothetical protein